MQIKKTTIENVMVITPEPFVDERGCFDRVFCQKEMACIKDNFVIAQVNHSMTKKKGSIRGLHFQRPPHAEIKIVRCTQGSIFDVAVDLRKDSPTYLKWHGEVLSRENMKMLVIPEGFAHGFQALEDNCEIIYFNTAFYCKEAEGALRFNDSTINIKWPLDVTVVSQKDLANPVVDEQFQRISL